MQACYRQYFATIQLQLPIASSTMPLLVVRRIACSLHSVSLVIMLSIMENACLQIVLPVMFSLRIRCLVPPMRFHSFMICSMIMWRGHQIISRILIHARTRVLWPRFLHLLHPPHQTSFLRGKVLVRAICQM